MDVEKELRAALVAAGLPAPVYLDVPEKRPAELYSVELTGSASRQSGALWTATVAVQCWAGTRKRARELMDALAAALPRIGYGTSRIGRARVTNAYRLDDLESGTPRYQAVIEINY